MEEMEESGSIWTQKHSTERKIMLSESPRQVVSPYLSAPAAGLVFFCCVFLFFFFFFCSDSDSLELLSDPLELFPESLEVFSDASLLSSSLSLSDPVQAHTHIIHALTHLMDARKMLPFSCIVLSTFPSVLEIFYKMRRA